MAVLSRHRLPVGLFGLCVDFVFHVSVSGARLCVFAWDVWRFPVGTATESCWRSPPSFHMDADTESS